MSEPVQVVDLRGEQKLFDIGKDRVRQMDARRVGLAVDRGRHAAGMETLDDLDQVDHRLSHAVRAVEIEAVRLRHQGACANQQIAKSGARRDAGMAARVA